MAQYNYTLSDFPNGQVDLTVLTVEIEQSSITVPLVGIATNPPDDVGIDFDGSLSAAEQNTLDGIVSTHQGIPFNDKPQRINVIAAQDNATGVWQEAARLDCDPISTERYDLKFYCELRLANNTNNGQARFRILVDGQEVASGGLEGVGFFDARGGSLVISTQRGASPSVVLEWRRLAQSDTAQIRRCRLAVVPLIEEG